MKARLVDRGVMIWDVPLVEDWGPEIGTVFDVVGFVSMGDRLSIVVVYEGRFTAVISDTFEPVEE